jgi:hypothetical protein
MRQDKNKKTEGKKKAATPKSPFEKFFIKKNKNHLKKKKNFIK